MNYTQNYRLPQWELSDRIMMQDFNTAMADIDGALLHSAQTAGAAAADTYTKAEKSAVLDGLFRLAYNRWHLMAAQESNLRQIGFFSQSFNVTSLPANTAGLMRREDYCWIGRGERAIDYTELKTFITEVTPMTVVKGKPAQNVPLTLTFNIPAPGKIMTALRGHYQDFVVGSSTNIQVVLTNLDTGEKEMNAVYPLSLVNSTEGYPTTSLSGCTGIYFHANTNYRLEFKPNGFDCNATFSYSGTLATDAAYAMKSPATADLAFQEEEASQGGLALIQYNAYGPSYSLTLDWDGETLYPYKIRSFKDAKGRTIKEAEYRKSGPISAESHVRMIADCGIGDDISLYSWGAMLI